MAESDPYLDPYREAVKALGAGFEATLWGTREAQQRRFDVMVDYLDLDDLVVLDVGCGHGDFAARLIERGVRFRRFVGLDALPEVIEAAKARGFAQCDFAAVDLVQDPGAIARAEPDVVCLSGTLNTMDDETARALISACFEAASSAVAFNFLSDRCHARWGDRDLTPARRFDTVAWLDWAMTLTSRVAFTQAYLDGHDATLILWRE